MSARSVETERGTLSSQSWASGTDIRRKLLARMQGAQATVPDLQLLIGHWPQDVHPEVERLDGYVQETLARIFPSIGDANRLRKMMAYNIALFGASWWPYTSFEVLKVVTCLSLWLFVWDDETDSIEFSNMANDWNEASSLRKETIEYLQASLARGPETELASISSDPIITCFKPVGEAISRSCDERQIGTFLSELIFFVKMCEEEQRVQMTPLLPSIEEYIRRRMGSSAVGVCLAIQQYACGVTLSQQALDDEDMHCILQETNVIISTTNDILSFKKEVALSQVDSLIPLLFSKLGSIQAAIDNATDIIKSSIQRFEATETRMLQHHAFTPETYRDIKGVIDGCKYACTANLNWSLTSGRYKLGCQSMSGGLRVTL